VKKYLFGSLGRKVCPDDRYYENNHLEQQKYLEGIIEEKIQGSPGTACPFLLQQGRNNIIGKLFKHFLSLV
jgi:hypothetical protein